MRGHDVQNIQKNRTTAVKSVALSRIVHTVKRHPYAQYLSRRFLSRNVAHKINKSFAKYNSKESSIPEMNEADREWLVSYYREPNERLRYEYGIDFSA